MSDEMTFDELEDTIVDYARDYDRAEHLRDTKWPDVEKAIAAHDAKVRAEQREELDSARASIDEIENRLRMQGYADEDRVRIALLHIDAVHSGKARPLAAIRAVPANTNTDPELSDSETGETHA